MARHIESRLQSACVEWFRLQYAILIMKKLNYENRKEID